MNIHHTITPQSDQITGDTITIITHNPGQAISEFHRRGLSDEGYSICGQIVPHKFDLVSDEGVSERLFGGEYLYSATFTRSAAHRHKYR
ncbi:MAG: AMP nucleosidase [Hyphomicrobiales bacterium]|nr:AMP nucleosidase [Hyphomicrobiales bacterium]